MPDLQPERSVSSNLKSTLHNLDLARAHVPHTEDPALDPRNQHDHRFHQHHSASAAHNSGNIIYADVGTEGRIDPKDLPRHAHVHRHGEHGEEDVRQHHSASTDPSAHPEGTEEKKSHFLSSGSSKSVGDAELRDTESQVPSSNSASLTPMDRFKVLTRRYRWVIVLFFGLFFTSWWISIIAQKQTRHRWLIPTFLWLFLMIRFITFYVPTRPLLMALNYVYVRTFIRLRDSIPQKLWAPIEMLIVLILVLVATFATPEYPNSKLSDRAVSFFGYVVFYVGFWAVSKHKNLIRWHTVAVGMFLQYAIALFVLRTKAGFDFFNWLSFLARKLLSFAGDGSAFLTSEQFVDQGFFAITTLGAIVFFIAFIHIWYYFGVLQWFVGKAAVGFFWLMQISGAEAVVVAATPFVGQGESSILIKPFLPHVTEAEMYQILVSGFSTISGSVLGSYVNMGLSPQALITSCVMSIPASVAASKLVYPESEETLTGKQIVMPEDATEEAYNAIHAFSNGAWLGLQVAFSVGTNILCIIALVTLIDQLLTWFGQFWGIPHLTLEQIMGYIFYPVAFLIGVSRDGDLYKVAKLLGTKIIQNEFVAFAALTKEPSYQAMSIRSRILATFALCSFSNLGSAGIQIGVLTKLAPNRKGTIASLVLSSLLVGCMVTYSSTAVAGMVMANMERFAEASGIAT